MDNNPPASAGFPNGEDARTCPACGWSAAALRDTGRMGCPRCYDAFPDMVERAVRELHRAAPDTVPAAPPTPPPRPAPAPEGDHPWPTRRARGRGDAG